MKSNNSKNKSECLFFCLLVFLLLGIGIYVYFNFLTFRKLFIYNDVGCDSFYQFWPDLVNLHRGFPCWSFSIGLGQNAFQSWLFDPLLLVIRFFERDEFILALPYLILIKILLAGVFFYLYLRVLSLSKYVSLFGAVSYAFCGQMILFSGWTYFFGTAYVVIAFLLYAVEMFIKRSNRFLLPLAVGFIPIVQSFYMWTFSILLFAYVLFRYIAEYKFDFWKTILFFIKFSGFYLLGVAMSAALFLPEFWVMLQSARVSISNSLPYFPPLFRLNTPAEIFTALLRMYSVDIMGIGCNFKGWLNYMEAPLFYCGLPVLLLIPQVFRFARPKLKILYIFLLSSIIWYVCFLYPRLILFAFYGSYFRIAAVFVVIILLYTGANALSYIEKKSSVDSGLLLMTLILLLSPIAVSILVLNFCKTYILDSKIVISVVCILVLYAFIIYTFKFRKISVISKTLLMLLLCIELATFSFKTVNNRATLSSDYIKSKSGYFDYTNDAVIYLKSTDKDFYRIDRNFNSVYLADSLFHGWKGTNAYGQWNQRSNIAFLRVMNVKQERDHPSWVSGFGSRFKLNTLVGVKYLLAKNKNNIPYGYKYLDTVGDVDLYENTFYLPLGFTYDTFIKMEDFLMLTEDMKDATLLEAFVWSDETDNPETYPLLRREMPIESYQSYENKVSKLRENTLQITAYSDDFIRGHISLDTDGLLFLSIPFDSGWNLKVNGEKTKIHKVNIGFMGVFLKKGFHEIDLKYSMPFQRTGMAISIAGFLIYLILLIRQGLILYRKRANARKPV